MKKIIIAASIFSITFLSGCGQSAAEKQAQAAEKTQVIVPGWAIKDQPMPTPRPKDKSHW